MIEAPAGTVRRRARPRRSRTEKGRERASVRPDPSSSRSRVVTRPARGARRVTGTTPEDSSWSGTTGASATRNARRDGDRSALAAATATATATATPTTATGARHPLGRPAQLTRRKATVRTIGAAQHTFARRALVCCNLLAWAGGRTAPGRGNCVLTPAEAGTLGVARPTARDAGITAPTAAEHPAHAVLEVAGVVKRWRTDRPAVLDGVDLVVRPGEVVGVLGRNGAGKTTLLRIAAGLITPDAGRVSVDGLDPRRDRSSYQQRLGFLSAGNSGLYGRLRVEHHLDLSSALAYVPREGRAAAIDRVRRAFELDDLVGQRVDRLSMGQRQRVRLALAFLHEPELALLDEPRTSLDGDGVAILRAAIDALTSRGGCAVVCAPDAEALGLECDRCLSVSGGRLAPA